MTQQGEPRRLPEVLALQERVNVIKLKLFAHLPELDEETQYRIDSALFDAACAGQTQLLENIGMWDKKHLTK